MNNEEAPGDARLPLLNPGDERPHADARQPTNPYAALPAAGELIERARSAGSTLAAAPLTRMVQAGLAAERATIAAGEHRARGKIEATILDAILVLERPRLAPVLNATGVIVHTNLGRAPVSAATARAMADAAAHPVTLEIDAATNQRGGRLSEVSGLMRALTGAPATLVVNNGAAAILLVLSALTSGREVVVSRGEAVEIGGGFRIPDVIRQSGASLVETGTTNRTYTRDYADATTERTAAWLKVHASNFQITGFAHSPVRQDLVAAAATRGVLVVEDLGSGALLDTSRFGLAAEPTIEDVLAAGVDIVTCSGDKLLGGPQAGLIVGRADLVEAIGRHPLARAARADKSCLAGLAETLRHYARGEAVRHIPVWQMIAATEPELLGRAESVVQRLADQGVSAAASVSMATIGGGSAPGAALPGWSVVIPPPGSRSVDEFARRLRLGTPGVFGRVETNRVWLDLRTVLPGDDDLLLAAIVSAAGG